MGPHPRQLFINLASRIPECRWGVQFRTRVHSALVGLALYVVGFYGFTAIFPWFAMARNMITIVSHIAFGMVLGLS